MAKGKVPAIGGTASISEKRILELKKKGIKSIDELREIAKLMKGKK